MSSIICLAVPGRGNAWAGAGRRVRARDIRGKSTRSLRLLMEMESGRRSYRFISTIWTARPAPDPHQSRNETIEADLVGGALIVNGTATSYASEADKRVAGDASGPR